MKYVILISLLLAGCASPNYATYVEGQKSLSRDITLLDAARVAALAEIIKNTNDPNVKAEAIRALQVIQRTNEVTLEPPKFWMFR